MDAGIMRCLHRARLTHARLWQQSVDSENRLKGLQMHEGLTHEELEVAVLILLQKAKLSAADKNALRFAVSQVRSGDFDVRRKLERLLRETAVEREEKKDTP